MYMNASFANYAPTDNVFKFGPSQLAQKISSHEMVLDQIFTMNQQHLCLISVLPGRCFKCSLADYKLVKLKSIYSPSDAVVASDNSP